MFLRRFLLSPVHLSCRIRVNKFWLRLLMRCCAALLLIWMCQRVINYNRRSVSLTASSHGSMLKYNITQADAGRVFFRHLIHGNDSFKTVNEHTICALIHLFFQEAAHNGNSIEFSSGMFILYDSTQRFFDQLMKAKNSQPHSNEHRSGYIRRPVYFVLDGVKSIFRILFRRSTSSQAPFIYVRGDESSHFRERGNKHDRWHFYPAYGMDIRDGCMPNGFSHILFGKLRSLSNNDNSHYRGDRIYIKPEKCGLQQFGHYLTHTTHYIRAVSHLLVCRFVDRLVPEFCKPTGAFHEWTDRRLVEKWTKLLTTIHTLTHSERRKMQDQVFLEGILEIHRQTRLFLLMPLVNDFRAELEHRYGSDVSARKGHEIIFTTAQLLNSCSTCMQSSADQNQQCDTTQTKN